MQVTVHAEGLKEVADFLHNFARKLSGSKQKWLQALGNQMLTEHSNALRFGGHNNPMGGLEGPSWEPTDEKWVALEGKGHSTPLYWTGYAHDSLNVKVSGGDRVQLHGPHYLAILHHEPGQGSKTRRQRVPFAGENVVPDEAQAEYFRTMNIHLKPREVLWVGDSGEEMARYFGDELDMIFDDLGFGHG